MIYILCYHSHRFASDDRHENDHVALREDLAALRHAGVPIRRLRDVVQALLSNQLESINPCVALTFDDGVDLDVEADKNTPARAPGFLQTLLVNRAPATTFVIASPVTRAALGAHVSPPLDINDSWWRSCKTDSLLELGLHSWDHNHVQAGAPPPFIASRGSFLAIDNLEAAQFELDHAQDFIENVSGIRPRHFAYPFGEVPRFLAEHYLPEHGACIGLEAAFTTDGRFVSAQNSRWAIPRIVCGHHWHDSDSLIGMIQAGNS